MAFCRMAFYRSTGPARTALLGISQGVVDREVQLRHANLRTPSTRARGKLATETALP